MESERYSWTCGWMRTDFVHRTADDAMVAAEEWRQGYPNALKGERIRIWRRKIEEVHPDELS